MRLVKVSGVARRCCKDCVCKPSLLKQETLMIYSVTMTEKVLLVSVLIDNGRIDNTPRIP